MPTKVDQHVGEREMQVAVDSKSVVLQVDDVRPGDRSCVGPQPALLGDRNYIHKGQPPSVFNWVLGRNAGEKFPIRHIGIKNGSGRNPVFGTPQQLVCDRLGSQIDPHLPILAVRWYHPSKLNSSVVNVRIGVQI